MNLNQRIQAALGEIPFDLGIIGPQLVNVLTGECYPVDVGIVGDRIAYVGPAGKQKLQAKETIDAKRKYLSPGLIDTHVHIESSMMTPANFAESVLYHGTTTVVAEPHEIANVLGLDGVRLMLNATENLPVKFFMLAPSCVPAVPGIDISGAAFGAPEINEMLSWKRVIGLAEVMDYPGVVASDTRMMSILEAALKRGALIGGHCPTLRDSALQAYMTAGPDSDHEVLEVAEMLEKIRSGMTIEAHESHHSQNISTLVDCIQHFPLLPINITMCIDDLTADALVEDGHLDRVLRKAVSLGLPAITALRIATIQAAVRCRLPDLGVVSAGKIADMIVLNDLVEFEVTDVVSNGQIVIKNSKLVSAINEFPIPEAYCHTIHIGFSPTAEKFQITREPGKYKARVVRINESTSQTEFVIHEFSATNGQINWYDNPDLCIVGVFERHGKGGYFTIGLIEGFGLNSGAIASTISHDSHNIIVIGRNPQDMEKAVAWLIKHGGGMVCVRNGKIMAGIELPVAGLLSLLPPHELARKLKELRAAAITLGIRGKDPLMMITELALPVIPNARFSVHGLVDVSSQTLVPFWVE